MRFVSLNAPQFYDLSVDVSAGVGSVLPAVANGDFYRITLTGEAEQPDLIDLRTEFWAFPNLELRDQTVRPLNLWEGAGEDSFEGVYFGMLKAALEQASEEDKEKILLAAKLSRQLLEGQEVALP